MNKLFLAIIGILVIAGMAYLFIPKDTFSGDAIIRTGVLKMYITDKPALNISSLSVTIDMIEVHKAGSEEQNVTPTTCEEQCQALGYGTGICREGTENETLCLDDELDLNDSTFCTPLQNDTVITCCCDTNTTAPEEQVGWIIFSQETQTFDLIEIRDVQEILGTKELEAGKYTQIRLHIADAVVEIGGEEKNLTIPSGKLKLIHPFYIFANQTTTLTLDFDAEKSVHAAGTKYILRPTIRVLSG